MKKIVFIVSLLCVGTLVAQKSVKADADKVTIYYDGALVEKSAKVSLKAGDNTFILKANSPFLWKNSIQFEANDNFMITDFTPVFAPSAEYYSYEDKLPAKERQRYLQIKDSIGHLTKRLEELKTYKAVLQKQADALTSMKVISQSQTVESLPKIKESLDYYRMKMMEITKEKMSTDEKITFHTDLLDRQKHLLAVFQIEYPAKQSNQSSIRGYYIRVNVYAERDIPSIDLKYSYICSGTRWYPSYDVKLYSDKDDVRFILKANLINDSYEDWKDVILTFSCESVNDNRFIEQTYPYYISNTAIKPPAAKRSRSMEAKAVEVLEYEIPPLSENEDNGDALALSVDAIAAPIGGITDYTTSANSLFGKEYTVVRKYSIRSESTTKTIALQTNDTKVDYNYVIRPKNDLRAYLQAGITSWQEAELVDADANVYFDNKYSTQTYVNPSTTQSDTMHLQLGADKRINVSRKVNKSTPSKTSFVGKGVETIVEVTIQVKNNNLKDINAEIEDRLPITRDPEIKIQALDLQGAEYEEESGKLHWNLHLKAGEMQTLKVKYSVRYPKGYILDLE